jgi:hypothetical protein
MSGWASGWVSPFRRCGTSYSEMASPEGIVGLVLQVGVIGRSSGVSYVDAAVSSFCITSLKE